MEAKNLREFVIHIGTRAPKNIWVDIKGSKVLVNFETMTHLKSPETLLTWKLVNKCQSELSIETLYNLIIQMAVSVLAIKVQSTKKRLTFVFLVVLYKLQVNFF